MSAGWEALRAEIRRWGDDGRAVEFWLRDDDAARPASTLERLFDMTARWQIPLALAVIPQTAEPALFESLPPHVDVLQHGFDHANRARDGQKKTEFPAGETIVVTKGRLCAGRDRLRELAGTRFLEVLAPPWNRIAADLLPRLAAWGFRGLSRFGPRSAQPVPGILEINAHIDLIAWKGGRGFAGLETVLGQAVWHLAARRHARIAEEPTGWLTHHASHDPAAWDFLGELFARLHEEPGVRWRRAKELFGSAYPYRAVE